MSYSRWSSSCWYTYPDSNGDFCISLEKTLAHEDLRDIEKCLDLFRDSYTPEEVEELRGYMQAYLAEYPLKEKEGT